MPGGLVVHRAERADALARGLASVLREPLDDPFAAEVVAVPAKGVERWLTQRLSHVLGATPGRSDGVCAQVRFPSPADLVAEALVQAGGVAAADDPWRRDRLTWPLLEVVDASVGEPWCATLAGHLGAGSAADDHRRGRRLSTAQNLARLFESYAVHRPAMLRAWVVGADEDGAGRALDADLAWQAELWRRLRERVGTPSPAERVGPGCDRLRSDPATSDLPTRVSLFGPTRLTSEQLLVLRALAAGRDVHLWLPHPSPGLWERLATTPPTTPVRRTDDATALLVGNPLLASLGRDVRELQLRLSVGVEPGAPERKEALAAPPWPDTLLGRVQRAVAADAPFVSTTLPAGDRSLQVHACHGRDRQVEVLREVLVGLLAGDESLEPRDVLVMCPDIEEFAPLVSATFGLTDDGDDDAHPGSRLRVRLADRSLRQTNPLLGVLAALLDLADARVTASQLLDLASAAPVRRRFRFSDDDLERLREWVSTSGVRWGLDAAHRSRFKLDGIAQNTWRTGLDRLLVGVAMAEEGRHWLGLALPLDDVGSDDVDLAGRFAEYVDRVDEVLDALDGRRPVRDWLRTLEHALDALTVVRDVDSWQLAQARRELARVATDAAGAVGTAGADGHAPELSLTDVRALLGDRLQGRPTRANFRTGTLTMCSLVPMRSVPHRVICLLGMDDGRFPRTTAVDGDDVLARDPCLGERDPRSEDRQLLLDAVMAAQEHLVVLHTGADPRTGQPKPPAVPVGELIDAADDLVAPSPDDPRTGRQRVVVQHPLQPFDPRNFTPGELGRDGAFSFDRHACAGARRAARGRDAPARFLERPLPPPRRDAGSTDVELDRVPLEDLIAFVEHPVRGFVRQRLGLVLLREEEEPSDALSVDLDGLQRWEVGDRLLAARLDGVDRLTAEQVEWRRGAVPPRQLGERLLRELRGEVEPLVAAAAELRVGPAEAVDVSALLGEGTMLTGTVDDVFGGDTVVRVVYSRLAAKHRLRSWLQLLALTVTRPDVGWRVATVGRAGKGAVTVSRIAPVDRDVALRRLTDLVELRRLGLREPLPLPVKTSAAYARSRRVMSVDNALERARQDWYGSDRFPGEREDAAHAYVLGERAAFELLLDDRNGAGDEPTRFGALAARLWHPLLAAEQLEHVDGTGRS